MLFFPVVIFCLLLDSFSYLTVLMLSNFDPLERELKAKKGTKRKLIRIVFMLRTSIKMSKIGVNKKFLDGE